MMICRSRIPALGSLLAAGCLLAGAEELDLTQVKTFDWSREENGREFGGHALLAPTTDLKEIAAQLKKSHGFRLSSEDDAHTVVQALGVLPAGSSVSLSRAMIDRFRQFIELSCTVQMPEKDNLERATPGGKNGGGADRKGEEKIQAQAERAEELVIGPAREAAKPAEAQPAPSPPAERSGENPTLLLSAGKLQPGTWWLRVKVTVKSGAKSFDKPVLSDSFIVRDDRPAKVAKKKSEPPEVGLQQPNSPSALQGTGFGQ